MANTKAPAGTVWVCAACGKTGARMYDLGSCICHAVLCYSDGPPWKAANDEAKKLREQDNA